MSIRRVIAIVGAAIACIGGGYLIGQSYHLLLPPQASVEAGAYDRLFRFVFSLASMIFLFVEGMLVYSVIAFRRRPGDETDGAPIRENRWLEIIWTIIPILLIIVLSTYSSNVLNVLDFNYTDLANWFHGPLPPGAALAEPIRGGELVVDVIARQFSWEFRYPTLGLSSPELHVPINKLVLLRLTSLDVIHSLWIPDFRIKKDANPGLITQIRFMPNKLGTFPAMCAELCGIAHAEMRTAIVVQTEQDFDNWVRQVQKGGAAQAIGTPEEAAKAIIAQQGCGSCHTLKAAGINGLVGPDLDGLGTRAHSRVPGLSAHDYVKQSLTDPKAYIVPGFMDIMPSFKDRLSDPELELLVNYLLKQ